MALGQKRCEKAEWTCYELVSTFWVARCAGKDDSREKRKEMAEQEDVLGIYYGALL